MRAGLGLIKGEFLKVVEVFFLVLITDGRIRVGLPNGRDVTLMRQMSASVVNLGNSGHFHSKVRHLMFTNVSFALKKEPWKHTMMRTMFLIWNRARHRLDL